MTGRRVGCTLAIALWALAGTAGCGGSPTAPARPLPDLGPTAPLPDLSGRWAGQIEARSPSIGRIPPTPLLVDLTDSAGTLTGQGGVADCRFFVMCGSFGSFTVAGTHDAVRVTLNGTDTRGGRTWTLTGTLSDGASRMSGTGSGVEFEPAPWELTRTP